MTDADSKRSRHARAVELARAGRHEEALDVLREHLLRHPLDAEALNDAGAILYALGRLDEATRHLETARAHVDGDPTQVLENLLDVYLATARPDRARDVLDHLADAGALTVERANQTAAALLDHGDCAHAVETLLRATELAPDDPNLSALLQRLRALRPTIGLFPGAGPRPLPDGLANFLRRRFRTSVFRGTGSAAIGEFLASCDVAWFEGCSPEAVLATRSAWPGRTIVHVAPGEVYSPRVDRITWEHVDLLATAAGQEARDSLARRMPQLARNGAIRRLPRGLALDGLPFTDRGRGKNLACPDGLRLRANPMGLLQSFRKLHEADPAFRLFFAGYVRDDALEAYLREMLHALDLADAVVFDGWQEDLVAWLADKHYVVSAAIDGRGEGLVEAMALGLRPVVHCYPGAEETVPHQALYRTDEEFRRRILAEPDDPRTGRAFVEEHFALSAFLAGAHELLGELERSPVREPALAVGREND